MTTTDYAAAYAEKYEQAVATIDATDEVKSLIRANFGKRGAHIPQITDLTDLAKAALKTTDKFGKKRDAWTSDGCSARMHLSKSIFFAHEQNPYSDDSYYYIPYTGSITNVLDAKNRLSRFFRRADTHTGYAGSGCNYTVDSIIPDANVVVLHCRASLSD